MIIKEYQVTLLCDTNQYKPVSCIIKKKQAEDIDLTQNKNEKIALVNEGYKKICSKKYWTKTDILKYHYTRAKVRLYDKEKIEAENKARYEALKETKYKSGEWKRPKGK